MTLLAQLLIIALGGATCAWATVLYVWSTGKVVAPRYRRTSDDVAELESMFR